MRAKRPLRTFLGLPVVFDADRQRMVTKAGRARQTSRALLPFARRRQRERTCTPTVVISAGVRGPRLEPRRGFAIHPSGGPLKHLSRWPRRRPAWSISLGTRRREPTAGEYVCRHPTRPTCSGLRPPNARRLSGTTGT